MGVEFKVLNRGTENAIQRLGSTSQMKNMMNALVEVNSTNGKKAGEGGWVEVKKAFENFGFKICYDRNLAILTLLLFAAIAKSGCSELISNAKAVINRTAKPTLDKKDTQEITLGTAFLRGDGKCIHSILNVEKFKNILNKQLLINEKYVDNYLDRVKHITPWKLSESDKTVKVLAEAFASMTGQKEGLGEAPPTVTSTFIINDGFGLKSDLADFKALKNNKIKSVVIRGGIQTISGDIFSGNQNLEEVKVENDAVIDKYAFHNCVNLKTVELSSKVRYIWGYAFQGCKNLRAINIPEGVENIYVYTFQGCTSLEKIAIPSSVENIYGYAFSGCKSLETVSISRGVKNIGKFAFANCTNLQNIAIPSSVEDISNRAFYGCKSLKTVSISRGVKNIGEYAFANCTGLKNIELPWGVEYIGQGAFYGCKNLETISIPKTVTCIDPNAFEDCENLSEIQLPDQLEYISGACFCGCRKLRKVNIPTSAKRICSCGAFQDCESLTEITIPRSVERIGARTFEGCKNLQKVKLPSTYVAIEVDAFKGCPKNMQIIKVDEKDENESQIRDQL
ncbi:MAG: leucine-rich repeat protein [Clostridia bacterium]|nr:leucine-rich repeat protein [Clostridia bacterium]